MLAVTTLFVVMFRYMMQTCNTYYGNEDFEMKQIKTLNKANLKESAVKGGCGECQTSCQSACKTSCTVANQKCENAQRA